MNTRTLLRGATTALLAISVTASAKEGLRPWSATGLGTESDHRAQAAAPVERETPKKATASQGELRLADLLQKKKAGKLTREEAQQFTRLTVMAELMARSGFGGRGFGGPDFGGFEGRPPGPRFQDGRPNGFWAPDPLRPPHGPQFQGGPREFGFDGPEARPPAPPFPEERGFRGPVGFGRQDLPPRPPEDFGAPPLPRNRQ